MLLDLCNVLVAFLQGNMHLISGLGALMVFPICVKPALMVHFRTFDSLEDVGKQKFCYHRDLQLPSVKPLTTLLSFLLRII